MNDLTIDTDQTRAVLTGFIREQLSQAGFDKVVLGLSGGLDSALACYLAAEAIGPRSVLAVRMPYRTSSPESLAHAQLVIDALGVNAVTIEITAMADGLINRFPDMDALRRGNIMARSRMIVLFDQSAAWNGLVVGTGNKTEILLGYTTLYGDSASAFNPIGGMYKTQVRQLARAMGMPEPLITKAPSADLWAGQTDEQELGFTYENVDRLLFELVDRRRTVEETVAAGFDRAFVETVVRRVRRNQFKRVLPPIGLLEESGSYLDFVHQPGWGR